MDYGKLQDESEPIMRALKKSILWFGVFSIVCAQTPGTQSTVNAETSAQLAEGKQTVAILDFEGRGISQMEAATLTDRLMSEMVSTNAVIMVERNQMNEILEEQGLQQAGQYEKLQGGRTEVLRETLGKLSRQLLESSLHRCPGALRKAA